MPGLAVGRLASHAESRKHPEGWRGRKLHGVHQSLPTAGDLTIRMDGAERRSSFMMNSGPTALDQV